MGSSYKMEPWNPQFEVKLTLCRYNAYLKYFHYNIFITIDLGLWNKLVYLIRLLGLLGSEFTLLAWKLPCIILKWATALWVEPSQIPAFTLDSLAHSMASCQYDYVRCALGDLTINQSQLYRQINSPCKFSGASGFDPLTHWPTPMYSPVLPLHHNFTKNLNFKYKKKKVIVKGAKGAKITCNFFSTWFLKMCQSKIVKPYLL